MHRLVTITLPEQLYNSVIENRAKRFIGDYFPNDHLVNEANRIIAVNITIRARIDSIASNFHTKESRIAFLTILLTHFTSLIPQIDDGSFVSNCDPLEIKLTRPHVEEIIFEIVELLKTLDVETSANAFTHEEFNSIRKVLASILDELEVIKAGNAVLGDQIDELQQDIMEIKGSLVLGKKSFKQRMTDVVTTYVATKGADVAFDAMKPHLGKLINGGLITVTKFLELG